MKLMPDEPTEEMMIAGGEAIIDGLMKAQIGSPYGLRPEPVSLNVYKAMLAAAPDAPSRNDVNKQPSMKYSKEFLDAAVEAIPSLKEPASRNDVLEEAAKVCDLLASDCQVRGEMA